MLWILLKNSEQDGRGLWGCWNPNCRCPLLPKSRRLLFSGFLPLDVSSPAVGDILRSGPCRRSLQRLCNIPIDNGHLARKCSIKIITLAVEDIHSWNAGTSEEDSDSQDSNVPVDHGHPARNFSINCKKLRWKFQNSAKHRPSVPY